MVQDRTFRNQACKPAVILKLPVAGEFCSEWSECVLLQVWMALVGLATLLVSLKTVECALSAAQLVKPSAYFIPSLTDTEQNKWEDFNTPHHKTCIKLMQVFHCFGDCWTNCIWFISKYMQIPYLLCCVFYKIVMAKQKTKFISFQPAYGQVLWNCRDTLKKSKEQ